MVMDCIEDQADMLALAAMCQVLWARWGREDDWPPERWSTDDFRFDRAEFPLFFIPDADPGAVGYLPFHIHWAERAEGKIVIHAIELKPDNVIRRKDASSSTRQECSSCVTEAERNRFQGVSSRGTSTDTASKALLRNGSRSAATGRFASTRAPLRLAPSTSPTSEIFRIFLSAH